MNPVFSVAVTSPLETAQRAESRGIEMMACDICKNNTKSLVDLREIYQSEEVRQVCPDCEKVLNVELSKIQVAAGKIQRGWFKNRIKQLLGKEST